MNKTAEIERIVMETLKDEQIHDRDELVSKIMETDPELLQTKNKLNAVLCYMKNNKNLIDTPEKKKYCLKKYIDVKEDGSMGKEVLKLWNEFLAKNLKYEKANYEMDEKDFARGKQIYEINKRIEEVLKEF